MKRYRYNGLNIVEDDNLILIKKKEIEILYFQLDTESLATILVLKF